MAQRLTELGYTVVTTQDAPQALGLLRSEAKIDVLFSDVIMPGGMNGAHLAVEARQIRPELKNLAHLRLTAAALSREHRLPENMEVLSTPYQHDELASRLRLVISNQERIAALHSTAQYLVTSRPGEAGNRPDRQA